MSKSWYVVNTKPQKELFAEKELRRKNICVFLPLIEDHSWKRGKVVTRFIPLFPGYLFVQTSSLECDYYTVKWTPGVKRFLGNGEFPMPIHNDIVDFLRDRASADGVIQEPRFQKGDSVRIKCGPFKDIIGIIENDTKPTGRVRVLMNLVNYHASIEIHDGLLERVDAGRSTFVQ